MSRRIPLEAQPGDGPQAMDAVGARPRSAKDSSHGLLPADPRLGQIHRQQLIASIGPGMDLGPRPEGR